MLRKIYISVLLKDNMIVGYHISPNSKTEPRDYYKDFYYACKLMNDEVLKDYSVEWIAVEYDDPEDEYRLNNFIFEELARPFFKRWKIHPEHFGSPAY